MARQAELVAIALLFAPMATSFAALLYRPSEISERSLSRGFAVALAGWDVPFPHLLLAPLPGLHGWSAAFYASGLRAEDELEHVAELFEDELSPAVGVLDAAAELDPPLPEGSHGTTLLTLIFAEDVILDDGWRFTARSFERHFVREGDDGIEAGVETGEASDVHLLTSALPDDAGHAAERAEIDRAIRAHRGSTFLSAELGTPVLAALMGALFTADRRLEIRLVDPAPASIDAQVQRLDRALRRVEGRAAFAAPREIAGVARPATYEAFVHAYDWADPADPGDLYRELSIGAIEGTLRFLREDELHARARDPAWSAAARAGLYPVAKLVGSSLGGGASATIGLAADGERLSLVRDSTPIAAGPTFGELVRYLALGWSQRSDADEDLLGALMLRARVRAEKG